MTDNIEYALPPHRTLEEVEALVDFIEARVDPLRVAAEYGSEEREAFEALLNLVFFTKGVAQARARKGDEPYWEFHSLNVLARRWKQHPDHQSAWDEDATGRPGEPGAMPTT